MNIIVAIARDGAIGRGGDQPFYIREDLRRFKALTTGHTIIMGRRTFEALPKGALPNRRNIVITRQTELSFPGAETAANIADAISLANDPETYVIGGGQIYAQALPLAEKLYVTEIDADVPDADTYFQAIDSEQWELTEAGQWLTDEASGVKYRFVCYSRK